jgi:hypothetical protein
VEQKKSLFLVMGTFMIIFLVIFYVVSLRIQLQELRANQHNYEEQFKSLSSIQENDAFLLNRDFLKKYFTYQNLQDRYDSIRPIMTDRSYTAIHEYAGDDLKSGETISSSITDVKSFRYQDTKSAVEFLNEFRLTTEFNNIGNTETVYVKTQLVYVKEQGWKVDGVEFLGQLSERG